MSSWVFPVEVILLLLLAALLLQPPAVRASALNLLSILTQLAWVLCRLATARTRMYFHRLINKDIRRYHTLVGDGGTDVLPIMATHSANQLIQGFG